MRYQRPAIIAASVVAFGAAVAVMLPPTKPIGGAKITSLEHQGFSPVQAAAPTETKPVYPMTTPPMAQPQSDASSNEVADADDEAPSQPDRPQASAVQMASPAPILTIRPPRPLYAAVRPNSRFAYADDPSFDDGRDYKQGYRWARRADVQDWRDCRGLSGAQVDGCQAYLRDMRQPPRRDYGDENDDRPY